MCGRYYRQSDKQKIAETFHVARWAPDVHLAPDYNIAPSTFQPIIRSSPEDGEREIVLMRWGLIPAKTVDPESEQPVTRQLDSGSLQAAHQTRSRPRYQSEISNGDLSGTKG